MRGAHDMAAWPEMIDPSGDPNALKTAMIIAMIYT